MIFGWKLDDGWSILITLPFTLFSITFCYGFALRHHYGVVYDLTGSLCAGSFLALLANLIILGLIHLFRVYDTPYSEDD